MLSWELWKGTGEEWNRILFTSEDHNVFQSFEWGIYKAYANWKVVRYSCLDKKGKTLGMAQLLVKKLPFGLTFIWSPGAPVFSFPGNADDLVELLEDLVQKIHTDHPRSVVRLNSIVETSSPVAYNFNRVCRRPFFKINSGYSVQFKIGDTPEDIKRKMTSKHRYYAKKASGAGIDWQAGNDDKLLADFAILHSEMVDNKKLTLGVISSQDLENMRAALGNGLLMLIGYMDGHPVSGCLVLVYGKKAFYMSASSGKRGRDVSAAYNMFEQLMKELNERGFTDLDFGGIDPINAASAGVNHYKCGFGGRIVEYIGEWESATSETVRLLINLAIRFKGGQV